MSLLNRVSQHFVINGCKKIGQINEIQLSSETDWILNKLCIVTFSPIQVIKFGN